MERRWVMDGDSGSQYLSGSECGDWPRLWAIVVLFCLWQWKGERSWMGIQDPNLFWAPSVAPPAVATVCKQKPQSNTNVCQKKGCKKRFGLFKKMSGSFAGLGCIQLRPLTVFCCACTLLCSLLCRMWTGPRLVMSSGHQCPRKRNTTKKAW